jgi:tartrate dehydratase alpha subunit/fumarate hydratase class I-like protein
MRIIPREQIYQAIFDAIAHITYHNDPAVIDLIDKARQIETDERVADVLGTISLNNEISPSTTSLVPGYRNHHCDCGSGT